MGWAPLSPPTKTYNWFLMAADDVWNVLGDGAGEGVAAFLRHGPKVLVSGFRTCRQFQSPD